MRTSKPLLARSPSSHIWLNRQSTDPYIKKRTASGQLLRSRSAYKLLEIDERYNLFGGLPLSSSSSSSSSPSSAYNDIRGVVDLGAAPGGWSQVVAEKLGWTQHWAQKNNVMKVKGYSWGEAGVKCNQKYGTWSTPKLAQTLKEERAQKKGKRGKGGEVTLTSVVEEEPKFDPLDINNDELNAELSQGHGTIVSVDLLPMLPIHGVLDIQADFLKPETEDLINRLLSIKGNMSGKADIILSDMAANMTGNVSRDTESSLEICESVFDFATRHLRTAESIGRSNGGVLL
jgi:23S rRNA (uridine2552-2'-O)-methyltransferase